MSSLWKNQAALTTDRRIIRGVCFPADPVRLGPDGIRNENATS